MTFMFAKRRIRSK